MAELKDYIDENLAVLARIEPGDKISYDSSKPGRLQVDKPGIGSAFRRKQEDSILNDVRYLKPITALFKAAGMTTTAARAPQLSPALAGIRNLLQTYAGNDPEKVARRLKVQEILNDVQEIINVASKSVQASAWTPSAGKFPTGADWLIRLKQARVPLTQLLMRVGDLLNAYALNRKGNPACPANHADRQFVREYLRTDIYLTLRHVVKQPPVPQIIQEVHDLAARKCCRLLGLTDPSKLKDGLKDKLLRKLWDENPGERPNAGSTRRQLDQETDAYYLTKAARQKYQLIFDDGLIYQFRWWGVDGVDGAWGDNEAGYEDERNPQQHLQLVPANSYYAIERTELESLTTIPPEWGGKTRQGIYDNRTEYFASCVVGFNRKFYIAQHQDNTNRCPFFHSSYFQGAPVLFAGGMIIKDGRLLKMSSGSGHYRPKVQHMVSALEALLMHGVSLDGVTVICWVPKAGGDGESRQFDAHYLLRRRTRVRADEGTAVPRF
jgi:hypothetical protein